MNSLQILIGELFLVLYRGLVVMLGWGVLSNYLDIGTIGYGGAVLLVLLAETISGVVVGRDTVTAEKRIQEVRDG